MMETEFEMRNRVGNSGLCVDVDGGVCELKLKGAKDSR